MIMLNAYSVDKYVFYMYVRDQNTIINRGVEKN